MSETLNARMRALLERELIDRAEAKLASARTSSAARAPPVSEDAPASDELERDVLRLAAAALRMPEAKIDPDENLANYGVDSIAITEIMSGISRFFGVSIAPTTFFEARHLRDLAQILRARYGTAIAAHYAVTAKDATPAPQRVAPQSRQKESAPDVAGWLARHRAARSSTKAAETSAAPPDLLPLSAVAASPARSTAEPVAIIGMEGMFPKSPDLAAFEANLAAGADCIEEIPRDRWDWRAVDGDPRRGPFSDVRHGGFLSGHDLFDAAFFNISPRDAELMDPQHRLFLECVWKLIEGAGHAPSSLSGRKVSLFLGINLQDYADLANRTGALDPAQLTGLGHVFCANRLSFLLDIHGPSQVIDTACSSSLVALHRAVQSIRHEGCEMAIAGGSNLILTPTQHILFARVGMLARDGRCKTFSRAANGYARAEGVGALLLKRLDLAERDGDRILGVIRGSAENHGGAASSLTAPNPRAQAQLIVEAHRQACIDPRTLCYVECHGTGTPLGDPVEIDGLKTAFSELRASQGLDEPHASYCGLGSVKSNIGHTETTAGLAGVIKVLLGLKAGKLWRSLHCDEPNPLIDLRGTPFYLLAEQRDWIRPVVDGHEAPRRAAVSSFGAGGANAHVVIEEYVQTARVEAQEDEPHLIPLSARTPAALREAAKNLAIHLDSDAGTAQSLTDIAYTLQTGRDAMRERVAFVVRGRAELRARIEAFAQGIAEDGVATGTVDRKGGRGQAAARDEDLAGLATHWCAGGTVAWRDLHHGLRRRVALPTYPFQRKRFWLPQSATSVRAPAVTPAAQDLLALHATAPGRFRLLLHPDAPFLRNHVVAGAPTLPGVVYLEIMRRAALAAELAGSLRQVVWLRPLVVASTVEIEILVHRHAGQQARIEVNRIDADGTRHLHAQARVATDAAAPPALRLDVGRLEEAHPRRYDATHIYALFDSMGLAYGPSHRTITSLGIGADAAGRPQVFGQLHVPAAQVGDLYALDPGLMDGAFQCALGMAMDEAGGRTDGAALPFALERLEVLAPCAGDMRVHIRVSDGGEQTSRVRTLDLDLMDADGTVCVVMRGFATRRLAPAEQQPEKTADDVLLLAPKWELPNADADAAATFAVHHVLLCGMPNDVAAALCGLRPGWGCSASSQPAAAVDSGFGLHAKTLLASIQEIARGKRPALLQVVMPQSATTLAALSGLLRSAQIEVPGLTCQLISVDPALAPTDLAARLDAAAQRSGIEQMREDGRVKGWRELARPAQPSPHPWRDGAVYLITGGAGALGQLFARKIASRAAGVTLVLASRRANASGFALDGALIEHAVCDVADAAAVTALVADIRARHGRLDGVLHAAGLLDDGTIAGKTAESLAAVLAPKVAGTCHLDKALGAEPLDLFLLFGSLSGAIGNPGQADYAAANAFLDAFAADREARRRAGLCHGRTLAVDWPLWRDGGMRISAEAERLMTRTTGFTAIRHDAAFAALYDALASEEAQVLVACGERARITGRLLGASDAKVAAGAVAALADGDVDRDELARKIAPALMQMVSAQLKVAVADLAADTELSEYGFDSISFTQFANALNDGFELAVTPTLFFEHPTLGELAAYFARDHAPAFARVLGVAARPAIVTPRQETVATPRPVLVAPAPPLPASGHALGRSPIAIVGMSGMFPGADSPEALWRNLLDGTDAIRDLPPGRWTQSADGRAAPRGGFMDGIGAFDAGFFNLSAPEARTMDPQQRLLLTQTWRLLEDAGYAPRSLSGSNVGVFIGIADTGYGRLTAQTSGVTEGYAMTGLAPSVGPNRVSFHFNFTGPSAAVETACSSALIAIHRAVEAIHSGDCTSAIAGGVNILLSPDAFEGFTRAGMLAPDGRSKPFSSGADGYGRGEGIGLVFLKRLDDARRDGDRILAVIRASAENHGGRGSSLTAPNPKAQAALLKQAYGRVGFDPRTVTYIEAHGTGTPLGDPIEIEALKTAFTALSTEAEARFGPAPALACGVGSLKGNIGHLELASGAASLIKVLLQMRHGTLAKTLNCGTLNPYLKLEGAPFEVVRKTTPWPRLREANGRELPRRAGISAFGFGGSNAHVVIEEYMPADAPAADAPPQGPVAIVLSARSQEQLADCARLLHDELEGRRDADLPGIAFTLQTCRDAMEHRLAFIAGSIGEVRARLAAFLSGAPDDRVATGRVKANREMLALLDSDADVRSALSGLPGRGRHDILVDLWVRGFPFDWRSLYGAEPPRRVVLPGYPFATTVHWPRLADEPAVHQAPDAAPPTPQRAIVAEVVVPIVRARETGEHAYARALERLTGIAALVLETDASVLDPDTELGEFGFDSITLTGFATRVNDTLGLSLTPADFFEFATLGRLARHIARSGAFAETEEPAPAPPPIAPPVAGRNDDPIAIVGMSCCFPGAETAEAFWSNLVSGVSSITEIPADRWDWRAIHGDPKTESNRTNIKFGGFIDSVFDFDPLFFGISPREAKLMDPQQRLMMMHVWKALEDAGHAPRSFAGQSVGLFVGTGSSGLRDTPGDDTGAESYAATGAVPSVGPNRVSYFLDWHGPSEPVETACSSALVALHRGIQAMRDGDCDIAVAGGINTIVTPEAHINFAKAGMLSLDGACKTFSSKANGYVRGEGVGMLVLKRLSEAERDGDAIYAIVRGSAINHGGRANSLTAPNTAAQASLIVRAYSQAGIDPATVGYIEAHGTGTSLGDPVEINALKSAFGALPTNAATEGYVSPGCGIGSAKTNVGHLELAAGVVGVIKVLLQLRHRTLAPSLNSDPPNPYINFSGSPFFVVREAQAWQAVRDGRGRELPRRAGVSSFGFGGVNAHVVLEEYIDRRSPVAPSSGPAVVPLSARDGARLAEQARQLLDHLSANTIADDALHDLAFTLQVGRTALKERAAFVVATLSDLRSALARYIEGDRSAATTVTAGTDAINAVAQPTSPEAIALHWASGADVDWNALHPTPRRRLHLPTYPFPREPYRPGRMPQIVAQEGSHGRATANTLSLDPHAFYLHDHRIAGAPVLPGVMTFELARAASGTSAPLSFAEIVWLKPVTGAASASAEVAFHGDGGAFRLLAGPHGSMAVHAQGKRAPPPEMSAAADIDAIRARCPQSRSPAWLYDTFASLGMEYGPAFRSVVEINCGESEVLARLVLPDAAARAGGGFFLHPSLVDGALQCCLALNADAMDGSTAVPFAVDRVDIFAATQPTMWAHIRQRPAAGSVRKIDIDLVNAEGGLCIRIIGFSVRVLAGRSPTSPSRDDLRAAAGRHLASLVAAETAIPVAQIELSASLDAYGIDSLMIVRLTDELEKAFGPLPKTLFFEYRTLDAVVGYFLKHHADRLAAVVGRADAAPRPHPSAAPALLPATRAAADLQPPVAIVGIAGRYPGARDLAAFWNNLAQGRDCITEIPADRWDHKRFAELHRGEGGKWGGFVDGVAEFDPLFFNISPRDAPYLDPQERLFLQCAYEAIEDAGHTRASLGADGDVGVFVGVMWEEYQLYGVERTAQGEALALSGSPASIANRVSSVCDFHGPSLAVDSMCSSSLSAIHLACESLALGTCTAAIAGGVNLSLHPNKYLALAQGRFISSSGRCESFGAGGDGYVPGEGVGAVVLKRLDRAVADGDQIYGVIRGSALNHGGKTNGYTVPNPQAQTAVIRRALDKAGVTPRAVTYVEAHGTGTKLGDPIEISALSTAYLQDTPDTRFCRIGSVKSNIGHCESAAGVAGLTKVLLQMKHGRIAPSLHSEVLNPGIAFDATPFTVQRTLSDWRAPTREDGDKGPLIAGLSSFGAGGSNAHFIVEAYRTRPSALAHAGPLVFPFSARDAATLTTVIERFLAALDGIEASQLASASYVLQQGREAFEVRLAVVAANGDELRDRLSAALHGETPHVYRGVRRPDAGVLAGHALDLGDLAALARSWSVGAHVDWARLWHGSPPRRISLPTYPFARDVYWVPGLERAAPASQPSPVGDDAPLPLLFTPDWKPRPAALDRSPEKRRVIVLCDIPAPELTFAVAPGDCHTLRAPDGSDEHRFARYAGRLLTLLQSLFKERGSEALVQVVVPRAGQDVLLEGLGGLLRTAMLERPRLRCQLISVDAVLVDPAASARVGAIVEADAASADTDIRHEGGARLVRSWRECHAIAAPGPWKDGGVYLLTGGAGGLGLLLAERIAGSVRRPVLWLTGRSTLSAAVRDRLAALEATVVYRRLDVTDAAAVGALIADITARAGRLDGIVHAAGITRDKLLVRKSAEELASVLAPKVAGLAALDQATADCDLDFMLLFASASGALGNAGQADYAAGNAFMDAFAARRNGLVARGQRRGLTLSIDWPYWRDGGMTVAPSAVTAMERAAGVTPLEVLPGLAALDAAVALARAEALSQVLVLDGDHGRLRDMLAPRGSAHAPPPAAAPARSAASPQAVEAYLAAKIAAVLKVASDKLDTAETFDRYGLDSVAALQAIDALEVDLGKLPNTLLFEYPTVAKLAQALLETHDGALRDLLHQPQPDTVEPVAAATPRFAQRPDTEGDIAIIAVAGRYPGAETPEELWDALREGRDLVTEVPPDRWDVDSTYAREKGVPGKSYCRWGGFLSNVDAFDAAFFGISPREASRMDPQERLFLETAWHLLERGGHTRRRLHADYGAKVGVFVGAMSQQYRALDADGADRPILTLTSHASLANRVSYVFDLQGPSVAVDSMCSSGLEAVHLACQALRRGECRLAIAGAVNLSIHPDKYIGLSQAGLIGSHRASRAFGAGDGYLPAEGVGAVLLKPLADALAGPDVILGVIKGTAVNHSGRSAGYGVPSADAQRQLIETNFREAGIDPRSIGYVEAAATGSALGDAIELRALTRAFRSFAAEAGFCAVGSVKANMGHAEAASGLAQLTKCLFQLQHRQLAPMAPIGETDPELVFDGSPFSLQRDLAAWPRMQPDQPLRAAISSFGAGGTNVHLILEEAPPQPREQDSSDTRPGPWRFCFSAASPDQLAAVVRQIADHVAAHPDLPLARLAWTLRHGRERLTHATEIIARDRQDLLDKLSNWSGLPGTGGIASADDEDVAERPLILPGYPFARTRHWIGRAVATAVDAARDHRSDHGRPVREVILAALAEETGLVPEKIPADASFRDLGAASMFGIRMIRIAADAFSVDLSHRDLEAHDSVAALSTLIESRCGNVRPLGDAPDRTLAHTAALSEGQLGLWVLQKLHPEMNTYNVPMAFRVPRFNAGAFERAAQAVLARYPVLSRRFVEVDGAPHSCLSADAVPVARVTLSRGADETTFLRDRAARAFDLEAGPPIRLEVIVSSDAAEDTALVLVVVHHIAIDGRSATIVAHDLWDAYARFTQGLDWAPGPASADFIDFVAYERAHLASDKGAAQLAYWTARLSGERPALDLPADRASDPLRPLSAASLERRVDPEVAQAVRAAAKALRVTRPAFFLAVLNMLLHRYTGAGDILVGMPVMGRPKRHFESSVGCFANMIVMRSMVSADMPAADLVKQTHATMIDGLDHADVPFATVARRLGRTPLDGPLYDVAFAYQNFFDARPLGAGATLITDVRQPGGDALGLELFEEGDALRIVANYDAARFDAPRVARMLDHFINLATAAAATPDLPLSALDMLCAAERDRILGPWATGGLLPHVPGPVTDWIFRQAATAPQSIAVTLGSQTLTYGDLAQRALALAGNLAANGVAAGDCVGVVLDRGPDSIVALLGVLSCGAVYVPLDAGQPDARLRMAAEDARLSVLVLDEAGKRRIANAGLDVRSTVRIDQAQAASRDAHVGAPAPVDPAAAAYIIFTSGSTGRPKGVAVSHASLADHCRAVIARYGLDETDRVLQFSAFSVDPSLEQILPALTVGATVVMRGNDIWTPAELGDAFTLHGVTVADLPPAYLVEVLMAWETAGYAPARTPRLLICGGEPLTPETVRLWRAGPLSVSRLINAYGPTEATITAIAHDVTDADTDVVPIGRPLPGTHVYVLDASGQPVPEGVPGELYIGGSRLALGYDGAEALSADRFPANPFGSGRLYRTGDRVAFLRGTEGRLMFLGRSDEQVKIRGFRVELGEIEAALAACGVRAVTAVRSGRLVAFVVAEASPFDAQRIANGISARLPAHMCPASYVRIDAVPLTLAGKVDRRALLSLADATPCTGPRPESAAPFDAIEDQVAGLWRDVFGQTLEGVALDGVALHRDSDFFACGGHSLLAVRLLSAIERAFGRKLSVADLIASPTVAEQARLLRGRDQDCARPSDEPRLVCLRKGTETERDAPLFLMHPVGGDVSCYLALARGLTTDTAVYGVQAADTHTENSLPEATDLAACAATYLRVLRSVQANGPYRLGGWSLGGLLAFEMARQLLEAGEQVAPLLMIDCYAPSLLAALDPNDTGCDPDVIAIFARDLIGDAGAGALARRDGRDILAVEDLYGVPELATALRGVDEASLAARFATFRRNVRMARTYQPEACPVAAHLFTASGGGHPDLSRGWRALALGGLTIHELPGDHYTVIAEPEVARLAPLISNVLRAQ
jgi:amino acid adenylation domain-containing protein